MALPRARPLAAGALLLLLLCAQALPSPEPSPTPGGVPSPSPSDNGTEPTPESRVNATEPAPAGNGTESGTSPSPWPAVIGPWVISAPGSSCSDACKGRTDGNFVCANPWFHWPELNRTDFEPLMAEFGRPCTSVHVSSDSTGTYEQPGIADDGMCMWKNAWKFYSTCAASRDGIEFRPRVTRVCACVEIAPMPSNGTWVRGAVGQSCDDACADNQMVCEEGTMPDIQDTQAVLAAGLAAGQECDVVSESPAEFNGISPGVNGYQYINPAGYRYLKQCFTAPQPSLCSARSYKIGRFCFCQPTTTTTASSSTASTATTSTTTVEALDPEELWGHLRLNGSWATLGELDKSCDEACANVLPYNTLVCDASTAPPIESKAHLLAVMRLLGQNCSSLEHEEGYMAEYSPHMDQNSACFYGNYYGRGYACDKRRNNARRACWCAAGPPLPAVPEGRWVRSDLEVDCATKCPTLGLLCQEKTPLLANAWQYLQVAALLGDHWPNERCWSGTRGVYLDRGVEKCMLGGRDTQQCEITSNIRNKIPYCWCTVPTTRTTSTFTTVSFAPFPPGWVQGNTRESCTDACARHSGACKADEFPEIDDAELLRVGRWLGESCNVRELPRYGDISYYPGNYYSGGRTCYMNAQPGVTDCDSSHYTVHRFCWCIATTTSTTTPAPWLARTSGSWVTSTSSCNYACSTVGKVCDESAWPPVRTDGDLAFVAEHVGMPCQRISWKQADNEPQYTWYPSIIFGTSCTGRNGTISCDGSHPQYTRFCWCETTTTTTRNPFAPVPAPQPQWVLGKLGTSCTFECQKFGNYWWNEAWSCVPGDFPKLSNNADIEALAVTLGVECSGGTGSGGNRDAHSISPNNYCIRATHSRGIDCDASGAYAIRMCWCSAPPTPAPPTPAPTPYVYTPITRGPTQSPYTRGPTQLPDTSSPTKSPAVATSGPTQSLVVGAGPSGVPTASPTQVPASASSPAQEPIGDSSSPMPPAGSSTQPPAGVPTKAPVANKRGVRVAFSWTGLDCGRLTAQGSSTRANFIQAIEEGILDGLKNPKVTRAHIITKLFCARRLQAASTASGSVKSESTIDAEAAQVPASELQAAVVQAQSAVTTAVQSKARGAGGIADVTITGELPTIGNFQSEQVASIPTNCDVDVCVSVEDSGAGPKVWLSGAVAAVVCTALAK